MNSNNLSTLWINGSFQAPLSQAIQKEYHSLIQAISKVPAPYRLIKKIEGTGGLVSVADLVAYQIGWGKSVLRWYKSGLKGTMPEMPGESFSSWNYTGLAQHFYEKYAYDREHEQDQEFYFLVKHLLTLVDGEFETGRLDQQGVWPWCQLASGKQWPLSKWIQVNTFSPYKKATRLVKNYLRSIL